jgi:mRNA interferase RelE/StbE
VSDSCEIVVTASASRAIQETIPEAVAFAVIDFITGPLLENPRRVGAPLKGEMSGVWSARRGTYRVLYAIDEARRAVVVLRGCASQRGLSLVLIDGTPSGG